MTSYRIVGQNLNKSNHQGIKEANIDYLNGCYKLEMFCSIYTLK